MNRKQVLSMFGIMSVISFSSMAFEAPPEVKDNNFDILNVIIYKVNKNASLQEVLSKFSMNMPTMTNKEGEVVPVEIPSYSAQTQPVWQQKMVCDKPLDVSDAKCKIQMKRLLLSTDFSFMSVYLKQDLAVDYPAENKNNSNKVMLDVSLNMDTLKKLDINKKSELVTESTPVIENHKLKFKALMNKGVRYSYLVSKETCKEDQATTPCGDIYMDLFVEKNKPFK